MRASLTVCGSPEIHTQIGTRKKKSQAHGEARARVRGDSSSTNIKFGQHKIRSNSLDIYILERDLKQTCRAERYCIFLFSS